MVQQEDDLWQSILFPERELKILAGLYEKYGSDLITVREKQRALYSIRHNIRLEPQLCDMEAEITYLRIREYRPHKVVEISPASGWSTAWILHALKDNGVGKLYSYDLVDDCTRIIPQRLSEIFIKA